MNNLIFNIKYKSEPTTTLSDLRSGGQGGAVHNPYDILSTNVAQQTNTEIPTIIEQDIVKKLTDFIQTQTPFSFSKYGDGEYLCALDGHGNNSDFDHYTPKLQHGLKTSFKYMIEDNKDQNTFIAAWRDKKICHFWRSLVSDEFKDKIQWADYHTFIVEVKDFNNSQNNSDLNNKISLYKAIQDSTLNKYIICNNSMNKMSLLFNTSNILNIPYNNWFDFHFDAVLATMKSKIGEDPQPMIITSCGMSAKVLIAELHKIYPNGLFLDVGSGPQFICTKRDMRGRDYSYETIYNAFKPILPLDWSESEVLYN